MSIDTLLEAARYLEWQAQQQQITREEEEQLEKAILSREAEQRCAEFAASLAYPVTNHVINHVTWGEELRLEQRHHQHHPPVPPPPLPPPLPIAIFPIPVVSATPTPLVSTAMRTASHMPVVTPLATALSPTTAPLLSPSGKDPHSPPQQQQRQRHLVAHVKAESSALPQSGNSPKQQPQQQQIPQLLQHYTGPIIATSQHTLLPQPTLTQQQAQPGLVARPNGAALEDLRGFDGKRRPGGAGTREVHNKLEKNRRAHLKECFETLKRNVPNVDEKKTSNLSVLRSALRYIQTLKRKEKEYEHEMERLAREKIATQQRLAELKNELSQCMDIMEIDRVLRQTVQPEDDQASTSTASEGEDNFDQDVDDDDLLSTSPSSLPKLPQTTLPLSPHVPMPPPSLLPSHIAIQPQPKPLPAPLLSQPQAVGTMTVPQAIAPAPPPPAHVLASPPQPTVIAHASVIQAVNHVLPAGSKHLTHIAPSSQPIGHITVHPVAHLPAHLYPQQVAVSQVGHITHTIAHHHHPHTQVNGAVAPGQQASVAGKPATVVAHHHPSLMGQTVLNPVTMVTMPSFPISTLKLV